MTSDHYGSQLKLLWLVAEASKAIEVSNFDKAWSNASQALRLITDDGLFINGYLALEEQGGYSLSLRCYRIMLRAALFQGKADEVQQLLQKAMQIAQSRNNVNEIADVYSDSSIMHIMKTEWKEALVYTSKALDIYKQTNNKEDLARVLGNLGIIQLNQGNLEDSMTNFNEALHLATTLGNKHLMASMHSNIANVYNEYADYNATLNSYLLSLETYESIGYRMQIAGLLGNIGQIYYYMKHYQSSYEFHNRARAINESLTATTSLILNYGNMGNCLIQLGKRQLAHEYIDKAIALSDSVGAASRTAALLGIKGMAYFDDQKWESALSCFLEWLQCSEKAGMQTEQMNACLNLSLLFCNADSSLINLSMAEEYAKRALNLAKSNSNLAGLIEALRTLANLYDKRGDYKEALVAYREFHDRFVDSQNEKIRFQLSRLYLERRLSELETKRSTEKARYEVELTSLQQLLDQQRREIENSIKELVSRNSLLHEIAADVEHLTPYIQGNGIEIQQRLVGRLGRNIAALQNSDGVGIRWDDHQPFMSVLKKHYPSLSPMEIKIAALLRLNLTSIDIAQALFLSRRTVEYHRLNIRKKLGLSKADDLHVALYTLS